MSAAGAHEADVAAVTTSRGHRYAEQYPLAVELVREAARWGVSVPGVVPEETVLQRWQHGQPLWGGWAPPGTDLPRLLTREEAAAASDAQLLERVGALEEAVDGFSPPPIPEGGEGVLADLLCRLALSHAAAAATPDYHLVLGAPGAGKTTAFSAVRPQADRTQADRTQAVHIQPDLLRTLHPWWCGGLGVRATLLFSDRLRDELFVRSVAARADVIEEAVGANPAALHSRLDAVGDAGYTARVTLVSVDPAVLLRRRLERTATTGRVLGRRSVAADSEAVFSGLRARHPHLTFRKVVAEGYAGGGAL